MLHPVSLNSITFNGTQNGELRMEENYRGVCYLNPSIAWIFCCELVNSLNLILIDRYVNSLSLNYFVIMYALSDAMV